MKPYISALLLLLFSGFSFAQKPEYHLGFASGIALPAGKFASKNLADGSFTLPGFYGGAEFHLYLPEKNYGAFAKAGLLLNPIDVGTLGYEKVNADPFLKDLYIRSEAFRTIFIIAGPEYRLTYGKSWETNAHLSAGVMLATTPYQLYKPEYQLLGELTYYEITSSNDYAFMWGGGTELAYRLKPWYKIGLCADYLNSNAKFRFESLTGERTDKRTVSVFNLALKLTMRLNSEE